MVMGIKICYLHTNKTVTAVFLVGSGAMDVVMPSR